MAIGGSVPPERYPWWVKLSLLGARSRTSQWFWVAASAIGGIACLALAISDSGIFQIVLVLVGIWGLIAAGLYFGTIRWIDRNGTWS